MISPYPESLPVENPSRAAIAAALLFALSSSAGAGQWLRGDLHSHSLHSDGDSPVAEVIASVETKGLDFFALTDHDGNMDGVPTHWDDPDYVSERTILLYGVEWTTGPGHANVWAAQPFDYAPLWQAHLDQDAAAAVAAAHAQGVLFSINHPTAIFCCPWEYEVVEGTDAVEVWNAMYRLPNFNRWAGHEFWDGLLREGRRVSGVGGSDTHDLEGFEARFFGHGNPTTWVYAHDASAAGVLAGIAAGHVSISYAPDAPRLAFWADRDGDGTFETLSGDDLSADGKAIQFRVEIDPVKERALAVPARRARELPGWLVADLADGLVTPRELAQRRTVEPAGDGGYLVGVLKNGELFRAWQVPNGDAAEVSFWDTPAQGDYYRIELRGTPDVPSRIHLLLYGNVLALTNPIYFGFGK